MPARFYLSLRPGFTTNVIRQINSTAVSVSQAVIHHSNLIPVFFDAKYFKIPDKPAIFSPREMQLTGLPAPGGTLDSLDGDDRRIFLDLKFSISVFFWYENLESTFSFWIA